MSQNIMKVIVSKICFGFSCLYYKRFSHLTKSRIFKNLHLRKKSRSQLSWHFREKPFQAPKILFKSPRLIGQESLSYGHLLKDRSSHFWEGHPFRFWYVEVQRQRRLKSTKTGISSNFRIILDLGPPRNQKSGLFPMGKSLYKKILWWGFWFKNWYFPSSSCCS